jgi:hypothetical protein
MKKNNTIRKYLFIVVLYIIQKKCRNRLNAVANAEARNVVAANAVISEQ